MFILVSHVSKILAEYIDTKIEIAILYIVQWLPLFILLFSVGQCKDYKERTRVIVNFNLVIILSIFIIGLVSSFFV